MNSISKTLVTGMAEAPQTFIRSFMSGVTFAHLNLNVESHEVEPTEEQPEARTEYSCTSVGIDGDAVTLDAILLAVADMGCWRYLTMDILRVLQEAFGVEDNDMLVPVKAGLQNAITEYDVSSAVNSFSYQGKDYWIDRDTRMSVMNSTKILKEQGVETTTLWFGTDSFTLPCDTVIQLLSTIEVYALKCYNVTAQHKATALTLSTVGEALSYDYTKNYPDKLIL